MTPQSLFKLSSAALLTAVLAACGGGGDDPVAGNPGNPGAPNTPTGGGASECMPAKGTQHKGTYRMTGGSVGTATRTFVYDRPIDFNGKSLSQRSEVNVLTYTGGPGAGHTQAATFMWIYAPESTTASIVHGYGWGRSPWDRPDLLDYTMGHSYNPPYVDRRFQLQPGQSTEVTRRATTETTATGQPPKPGSFEDKVRVTYQGQETVNVTAGSFVACKFTREWFWPGDNTPYDTETRWLAKGTGVELKFEGIVFNDDDPIVMELVRLN